MTIQQLIDVLQSQPDKTLTVTRIWEDFHINIKGCVEVIDATAEYGDLYAECFYPEFEDEPVVKIAVLS